MDACQKCGKPAESRLKHLGPFCAACYCGMIERRVRRDLRESKPFPPRGKVHLLTDSTLESQVAERLIRSIVAETRTTLTTGPKAPAKAVILLPLAIEDDAEGLLTEWLLPAGAQKTARPEGFALLRSITREEIAEFARLQGIAGELRQPTALGKLFEELASEHPEVKFGLQRSRRALEKVLARETEERK
jgi:hypothetical protein